MTPPNAISRVKVPRVEKRTVPFVHPVIKFDKFVYDDELDELDEHDELSVWEASVMEFARKR